MTHLEALRLAEYLCQGHGLRLKRKEEPESGSYTGDTVWVGDCKKPIRILEIVSHENS